MTAGMRAVRCLAHGEPEALVVEDLSEPIAGDGEVVVDVHAASVNFPDALLVANRYQASVPPPFTPGSDLAGVVRAIGPGALGVAPGDRVYGSVFVGAFAERVRTGTRALRPLPDGVDFAAGAAFPTAYHTTYDALRTTAALQRGETLVVLGAAGGVGSAGVQIGKLLGARVIACASSPEKLALVRALGADESVDYTAPGFKERLKALAPSGVDVVLDPVGGPYAEPALRACGYGSRFVVVGFATGEIPRIPLNLVLLKGVAVKAYEAWGFAQHEGAALARNRDELHAHLASGALRPHVSSKIALAETASALRAMLERRATGKIVVEPTR
jgi:NADPH2:quinone reductase